MEAGGLEPDQGDDLTSPSRRHPTTALLRFNSPTRRAPAKGRMSMAMFAETFWPWSDMGQKRPHSDGHRLPR